jgi:hypothetical protein
MIRARVARWTRSGDQRKRFPPGNRKHFIGAFGLPACRYNRLVVNVLLPIGRWASDFSTFVPLALSTYNPTKNKESQRSSGEACAEGADS